MRRRMKGGFVPHLKRCRCFNVSGVKRHICNTGVYRGVLTNGEAAACGPLLSQRCPSAPKGPFCECQTRESDGGDVVQIGEEL
jgi:hypothetical protein